MSQSTHNGPQNGLHPHQHLAQQHHLQQQQHSNQSQQQHHHSNLEELLGLLRTDVPEGRQTLLDTRGNLEKVADYCATTYLDTKESQLAFEKTKNYTTHSLASVAFQINTLAFNILHMFELQTNQIAEMESQMNYIGQKVSFHKEKVARREIALLTTTKNNIRKPKVLVPANKEKQAKYIRKPIDYSLLDDIGHGVKIPTQQGLYRAQSTSGTQALSSGGTGRMSGIQTLGPKSSMSSLQQHYNLYGTLGGNAPAPTTKPPTPPQTRSNAYGTISRSTMNKDYRALAPPIAPPQVPKNYEPNYPIGHPKNSLNQGNASTQVQQNPGNGNYMPYPSGQSNAVGQQESTYGQYALNGNALHSGSSISSVHSQYAPAGIAQHMATSLPPPPNMMTHPSTVAHGMNDSLPEPPPPHMSHYDVRNSTASPPLPPPPPPVENDIHQQQQAIKNPNQIYNVTQRQHSVPEWVPHNYIEKVIAIYDYTADKDDELTFKENSVIYVTKKNDDGWYEGVMNGLTGLFPGNYIEPTI